MDLERNAHQDVSTAILDEYIILTAQIKTLDTRLNQIKPIVVLKLDGYGGIFSHACFDFTVQQRKSFDYSPAVKNKEKELKALKSAEEAEGIAKLKMISRYPVAKAQTVIIPPPDLVTLTLEEEATLPF